MEKIYDISQLAEANRWWVNKNNILDDFKIINWEESKYKWSPNLKKYIKLDKDVIYTVRGPRQVGKTTLIKLIIKDLLLEGGIDPENIFFWSFESNSPQELNKIIDTYLRWRSAKSAQRKYLFLDEISAVNDWQKEIMHFSNRGDLVNCSVVITGSHSMDIKYSTERMPGRRGGDKNEPLDKILMPMKFSEYVKLVYPEIQEVLSKNNLLRGSERKEKILNLFDGEIDSGIENLLVYKKELDSIFDMYLYTGGIPYVINEYLVDNEISTKTFNSYIGWIIGDLQKYKYKEDYFKQIIKAIFKTMPNPISWNSLKDFTDIKTHTTIQDYVSAMEDIFVGNITYPLSQKTGGPNPVKNKKIYISDPFIFHALHGWAHAKNDYFENLKANLLSLEMKSKLIECVVHNHLCRWSYGLNPRDLFDPKDHICYYRDKKEREIDFVAIYGDKIYPFEVKYQSSISNSDFSNFSSFNRGLLISKDHTMKYKNYYSMPISLFLLMI